MGYQSNESYHGSRKGTWGNMFSGKYWSPEILLKFNFELILNTLDVVSWLESIEWGLVLDQLALVLLSLVKY